MEVIKAIRKLLFLEDCVIIPGLGGFVSHYRPAVIDRATGTFIPPAKEIVFNNELVQNDGILVSFIAEKHGTSMDAARRQVDRFVDETRKKLEQNQTVFIDGIGQFNRDKSRKICFQTEAGTNLFLESFGLASFHMREVVQDNKSGLKHPRSIRADEPPRTIDFVVSEMKRTTSGRNLRRIAIAMPLLIAFSLLPYNSRVTDTLTSSPASMLPEPSLFRLNYPDSPKRDTARAIVFPIGDTETTAFAGAGSGETVKSEGVTFDAEEKGEVKREEVKKEEVKKEEVSGDAIGEEVKTVVGKFPVIAGCFKIKSNAEKLHKQLIEKGYPAAITTSRNGLMYKVCVETFASREEAVAGLARLKSAEPALELWVAL